MKIGIKKTYRIMTCYECGFNGRFSKKKNLVYCPNCGKVVYGKNNEKGGTR